MSCRRHPHVGRLMSERRLPTSPVGRRMSEHRPTWGVGCPSIGCRRPRGTSDVRAPPHVGRRMSEHELSTPLGCPSTGCRRPCGTSAPHVGRRMSEHELSTPSDARAPVVDAPGRTSDVRAPVIDAPVGRRRPTWGVGCPSMSCRRPRMPEHRLSTPRWDLGCPSIGCRRPHVGRRLPLITINSIAGVRSRSSHLLSTYQRP